MTPAEKVMRARTNLVLDQPFFGALALRLKIVEDTDCPTAWTDGTRMGYNPEFMQSLTHDEVKFVVAHEVMHCAMGHPWRKSGREHKRFNIAADLAINPELIAAGFTMPEGGLQDAQFDGKSAEFIYDRLPQNDGESGDDDGGGDGDGDGDGQSRPGSGGSDVRDAPPSGGDSDEDGDESGGSGSDSGQQDKQYTEADWQTAVQQAAAAAKAMGNLPGNLKRFAEKCAESKVDWRSVLHRFVQQRSQDDYSWRRPNVRYLPGGMYLPAMHSESMGPLAVAIDTSGSIDDVTLGQFQTELQAVVDSTKPELVQVIYCDSKVSSQETFYRGQPINLTPTGGGGTAFEPALRAATELAEPPVCMIYLTDLYGPDSAFQPDFPVLWVSVGKSAAPFGEVINIR